MSKHCNAKNCNGLISNEGVGHHFSIVNYDNNNWYRYDTVYYGKDIFLLENNNFLTIYTPIFLFILLMVIICFFLSKIIFKIWIKK